MNKMLTQLASRTLREIANKLDTGQCEITPEESEQILKAISYQPLSKAQAYHHLGICRAKFDNLVKEGKLPEGQHRLGFKEKVWYLDELNLYLNENN